MDGGERHFRGLRQDKFGPDDPITREQLAAIFYRYADYKGYDLTVKGDLDKFKDADKITDYAKTAMQWAVGSDLVNGKSGNLLDPQGTATRAEIAAMLHRFIEKYELVQGKAPGGLMGWIDPKRLQIPKDRRQQRVKLVRDLPLYISCRMPCADHMADQAAA